MPPKRSQTSRDLVQTGPKHVSGIGPSEGKKGSVMRPSSSRALVLRNGKYGAMGTGELVSLRKKLSGREKLDLLAEDLVQRAVMAPFRLEQCLNIASSQFDAYLDEIADLKDPALFCNIVRAELDARSLVDPQLKAKMLHNPSHIASTVATKIHNTYMLAAGWKVVLDTLVDLASNGLTDDNIKTKLKTNSHISLRYLILYDIVGTLVNLNQAQFAALAMTTPHYARYFKRAEDAAPDEPDVRFDWTGLREACLSFIDSIIIELCFPRAPYPRHILFSILRDAVEEAPKDAKRFPQALWDAVGDFSASLNLYSLIEAPLLGSGSDNWKNTARAMPEKYEQWVDAQIYSAEASSKYANFTNLVNPLDKTKNPSVLKELWSKIELNYKSVAHKEIDILWGLAKSFNAVPQWHAFYTPFPRGGADSDNDVPETKKKSLVVTRNRKVAVESDSDDSTPSSLPSLRTVSGSSEESDDVSEDSSDENTDDESGYDTDEEEELREFLRAAMDVAHEADFYDSANLNPDLDPLTSKDARDENPFLKLLGSLRGRLFSSDPKLKVGGRSELRKPKTTSVNDLQKTPLEEIGEDEEEEKVSQASKKKKKKTKKKPAVGTSTDQLPITPAPVPVAHEGPSKTQNKSSNEKQPSSAQIIGTPKPSPAPISTTSLLTMPVEPTVAQSARSYIKTEHLDFQKSKTKTRSDQASIFSNDTKDKSGFLAKFRRKSTKDTPEEEQKKAKRSWFTKLSKKASNGMHQLLRTSPDKGLAPMKWDNFVSLMIEMGFAYHPETSGSSVRFDPPDGRDKPITIHKPHPDSTLQPVRLRDIASRLNKYYGWNKEEFLALAK
ncbi:hypothetical protein JOM56_002047 [Amanita muscaria]